MKNKRLTEDQARLRLADLCARTEQCESDLLRKMRLWGLTSPEQQNVLRMLQEGGFVDNGRYAGAFARDKAKFAKWGRNKIRMALRAKGISPSYMSEALDTIDEDEYLDALRSTAAAKTRGLNIADPNDRHKLYSALIAKGYESSLIIPIINELKRGSDE